MAKDKSVSSTDGKSMVAMKPSGAIEIMSGDLSLIQRKAWNILLANSHPDITKKDRYSIPITEICRYLGYKDYATLKECLEKLVTTSIKFNYLKSRDKSDWWEITALLAQAVIKNGVLNYAYSPLLRDKINSHEYYAKINLLIQKNIDSKYALILYEMAKNHYIESKGFGFTPRIPIDDLRTIFGCKDNNMYDNFKYFSARVIKRAVKEVNEKSEIKITPVYHRQGKSVNSVQFKIEAKADKSGMLSALVGPKQRTLQFAGNELYQRLIDEYELTKKQAADIINQYDEDYIREKLVYVTRLKTNGSIKKSIAAATYDAITQNYEVPVEVLPPQKSRLPEIKPGTKIEHKGKRYIIEDGLIVHTSKKSVWTEMDIRQGIANKSIKIIE